MKFTWKHSRPAPQPFTTGSGAAVALGNIAYFSHEHDIYSFTTVDHKWTKLPPCKYRYFSLAAVDESLTTVGGSEGSKVTNALLSFAPGRLLGKRSWKEILPSMPTGRIRPATIAVETHLVVAGGQEAVSNPAGLCTVEVLDMNTKQWSLANGLPQLAHSLQMTICDGDFYLSNDTTLWTYPSEDLLQSCTSALPSKSVWIRLANIPLQSGSSLVALGKHVLALGGYIVGGHPAAFIDRYDCAANSWSVIGSIPTPRSGVLTAVLASSELIVVGGYRQGKQFRDTDIGTID